MPVVGDELAALVSDRVEVAANLDAPALGVLADLVFLSDVDRERTAAHLRRVSKFELVRRVREVIGTDDDVDARHAGQQPHGPAAVVLDGLGGCLTCVWHGAGASSQRASRQGYRQYRSRPRSDAARTPRRSCPGACVPVHLLAGPTPRGSARGSRYQFG